MRLLIDRVSEVALTPDHVKPLEIDPRQSNGVIVTLGKALNYLANGPKPEMELAGWMMAGVATTIIAAAHENQTQEAVDLERRSILQHALSSFAGLRQIIS